MSDPFDPLLDRLTPRCAPPDLRARTIARMADEVSAQTRRAKQWRRAGVSVAVLLILAVGLNFWVNERNRAKLAALYGPEPRRSEIESVEQMIESATDAETARWFMRQMTPLRQKRDHDSLKHEQVAINSSTNS